MLPNEVYVPNPQFNVAPFGKVGWWWRKENCGGGKRILNNHYGSQR